MWLIFCICVLDVVKKTHTLTQTGRQKLSQPVKEVKISLRAKGEGQMKEESISSLLSVIFPPHLASVCFRSPSNSSLEAFSALLCSCLFLFATPSPLPPYTSLPSSWCPFIRTLVNFFPSLLSSAHLPIPSALFLTFVVSVSLSFSLSCSPPVILHHVTLQLVYIPQPWTFLSVSHFILSFYFHPSFALWLTWYLVGCFLDFLGMNSSPGCG